MTQFSCSTVFSGQHLRSVLSFVTDLIKRPHYASLQGRPTHLVGLLLITLSAHLYYRNKFSFWSRRNVKTPPPIPIFGNLLPSILQSQYELELERSKKYGKVYGLYLGTKPYLVVADVDVLRQICIKHFDKFPNHSMIGVPNRYDRHFLFILRDNQWRSMRALLSPTFSSGKIKKMFKLMDRCVDDLIAKCREALAEKDKGEGLVVKMKELLDNYTLESAMSTFYSVSLPENKKGPLSRHEVSKENLKRITEKIFKPKIMNIMLSLFLPNRVLEVLGVHANKVSLMDDLSIILDKIIEHRKRNPIKHVDYLQIVLDANSRSENPEQDSREPVEDQYAMVGDGCSSQLTEKVMFSKRKALSKEEVSSQAIQFALVNSTVSVVLDTVLFILAHHGDHQTRLYEELIKIKDDQNENKNPTFDYERLNGCEYLDCVVSESLRLMPPALFLDRVAAEDYTIEKYGIEVPKGTVVNLSFLAIMHDPDYWPEPDKFDPERFNSENKTNIVPESYCPFGIGPRSCIAFRYALMQVKVTLAKMVCTFKIEPSPGSEYPAKPKRASFGFNLLENLFVKLSLRS